MRTRRPALALSCAVAVAALLALGGCGSEPEEAHREGLALPLEGITYNVFITRQLNLRDVEDRGYVEDVPEPPPGSTYYGIFLEACNVSDEPLTTTDSFRVVNSTGAEFEPIERRRDNPFAYTPTLLEPEACLPAEGSVAASGPTGGALLIFELPLEATENRPLELLITDGFDVAEGDANELRFELDL